jgi:hypothetical protein
MIYNLQHILWDDVIAEGGTGGIYIACTGEVRICTKFGQGT